MENDTENQNSTAMATVIININGGNNQILPNATGAVPNFYGTEFAHAKMLDGLAEEDEDEAVHIARGTLSIYYSDAAALNDIIRRIADCRNASDLANLVVNDMHKHTILTFERMVSKYFIEALQQFLTFKSGASTGNIRTQINKVRKG
ncbi:MAG: hypothetical protein LUI85_08820 [Bacteroides sp.]|nr:hypothetical protein [Bacteroides sp.]